MKRGGSGLGLSKELADQNEEIENLWLQWEKEWSGIGRQCFPLYSVVVTSFFSSNRLLTKNTKGI